MIQTTKEELDYIVSQLKPTIMEYLKQYSVGVGEIELAASLDGINSLPCLKREGGVDKVVEVPLQMVVEPSAGAIEEANAAAEKANTAAENANTAAGQVNDAILDLSEERAKVEQAVSQASGAADAANTARESVMAGEEERISNETGRVAAEQGRVSAENSRVQEFAQLKAAAEKATSDAAAAAVAAGDAAELSSNPPKIQNGTWWIWDTSTDAYVDSHSPATGRSPKIQNETWWVWDDTTGAYVNTGVAVNSTYELTKEKVESVLTGNITSHSHNYLGDAPSDDKTYGRKNGAWEEVSSGGGSVNISDIFMRIIQSGSVEGTCSQEDYNTLKSYAENGTVVYVGMDGTFTNAKLYITDGIVSVFVEVFQGNYSMAYSIMLSPGLETYTYLLYYYDYTGYSNGPLIGYRKKDSYSKITDGDSIMSAIEKLEAGLTPSVKTSTASSVKRTISPNVFYKYGVCSKIEITFTAGDTNSYNEYMLEFQSGETPTELILPNEVKWTGDHAIESNMTYQVSIVNNLAVMGGWANE